MNPCSNTDQRGFTLIECMIALALGALIIIAATALLLSAQQTYLAIDGRAQADDSGAYAMGVIGDAIRQAGYADHGGAMAPPSPSGIANTLLTGIDQGTLKRRGDTLSTRFMATGATGAADHHMRNCAGMALPAQAFPLSAATTYNWSGFYHSVKNGESQLFCQYRTSTGDFDSAAIARGITGVGLLYGVDFNGDGLPETFLDAQAMPEPGWRKVTAVIVTLSMHAASGWRSVILLRNPSSGQ
jgi:type IV pilus assembly protein PilW